MSATQKDTRTTITVTVRVWRQALGAKKGRFVDYDAVDIPIEASFLEMLDILNETLVENSEDPIAFESDCREGICGTCGVVVDGQPPEHGAQGALAAGLLLLLLEELVAVPVDEVERGDGRVPDLAQPREDLGNGAWSGDVSPRGFGTPASRALPEARSLLLGARGVRVEAGSGGLLSVRLAALPGLRRLVRALGVRVDRVVDIHGVFVPRMG